jgi:HEAT repeat
MTKIGDYRRTLAELDEWEPFLLAESGLPGPRGNIELGQAVADVGSREELEDLLTWTPEDAPVGSREEFLAFCGTVGLGKLAAEGELDVLPRLRALASDPRWRIREAVAMALQRLGVVDMRALLVEVRSWARGNDLERRAAIAGPCEPALLRDERDVREVLAILDIVTEALSRSPDRRSEGFRALRKGLAYCWSVAVAAAPDAGRPAMERWMGSENPDVRWVMTQNLTKRRLQAAGADWVARWRGSMTAAG